MTMSVRRRRRPDTVDIANGAFLGIALIVAAIFMSAESLSLAGRGLETSQVSVATDEARSPSSHAPMQIAPRTLPSGERVLRDASGRLVPLRDYRRIVAGSTVARTLLLALAEPDRIAAVTDYGLDEWEESYRLAGIPTLASLADLESLLALEPDLVLIHALNDERRIARMQEAGLAIFDLGEMRGLSGLKDNIAQIAALLDAPERGRRYADALVRRMAAVADDITDTERRSALYISMYGNRLFGGSAGTSFADVFASAGLNDAAADANYRGWPQYSIENVLVLDPDIIITHIGMGAEICRHPGLAVLRACVSARKRGDDSRGNDSPGDEIVRDEGGAMTSGIVEVPGYLLTSPGPEMLEAAESVRAAVYGPRRRARLPSRTR